MGKHLGTVLLVAAIAGCNPGSGSGDQTTETTEESSTGTETGDPVLPEELWPWFGRWTEEPTFPTGELYMHIGDSGFETLTVQEDGGVLIVSDLCGPQLGALDEELVWSRDEENARLVLGTTDKPSALLGPDGTYEELWLELGAECNGLTLWGLREGAPKVVLETRRQALCRDVCVPDGVTQVDECEQDACAP